MNYFTHGGLFHADEVAGYAICRLFYPGISLIRIPNTKDITLETLLHLYPGPFIVGDILRQHDPENGLFDHHQEFLCRANGYPYATAGLLWKHLGAKVVYQYFFNLHGDLDRIQAILDRVDDRFIRGLDAHDADAGFVVEAKCSAGSVSVMTLSQIVSSFNWTDIQDHAMQEVCFLKAADLIQTLLVSAIKSAYQYFESIDTFSEKAEFVKGTRGRVLVLQQHLPWKEIVCTSYPEVRYVITPSAHSGNPFALHAVPLTPESRVLKFPIQRSPRFDGFIHNGQFIAGGNTIEELIDLAMWNIDFYTPFQEKGNF